MPIPMQEHHDKIYRYCYYKGNGWLSLILDEPTALLNIIRLAESGLA